MNMTANAVQSGNTHQFSLSGTCPHCNLPSVFQAVTPPYAEMIMPGKSNVDLWAVLKCIGCAKYICGHVRKSAPTEADYVYQEHYPLGKPNDSVPEEISNEAFADDFKEALRCRFVNAFNATVEMCRRSIQSSCIKENAPQSTNLAGQIDWLFEQGRITRPLMDMAHKIRLGGNRAAHPSPPPAIPPEGTAKEPDEEIVMGPEYADAVIEFTREYFQHVYVMPKRLSKYDFSRKRVGAAG